MQASKISGDNYSRGMLAQAVLAQGSGDMPFVKLTGLVIGVLLLYWAIRRLLGSGNKKR